MHCLSSVLFCCTLYSVSKLQMSFTELGNSSDPHQTLKLNFLLRSEIDFAEVGLKMEGNVDVSALYVAAHRPVCLFNVLWPAECLRN